MSNEDEVAIDFIEEESSGEETKKDAKGFFNVEVPDILQGISGASDTSSEEQDEWYKVKGWYNELNFYSKVFQFFVEEIKERESKYGWWIIVISTMSSFATLFALEPFDLSEADNVLYNWTKNLVISVMTFTTTLIAAWVKKKGYVKRIQAIDKRIARLEKFLGVLDYQTRLVPKTNRENYMDFITKLRDEHNNLAIYSTLISPSEFTRTVYIITRYNAPLVNGTWPWYNTVSKTPRADFALNIIRAYEAEYSCRIWCRNAIRCKDQSIVNNPLLLQK